MKTLCAFFIQAAKSKSYRSLVGVVIAVLISSCDTCQETRPSAKIDDPLKTYFIKSEFSPALLFGSPEKKLNLFCGMSETGQGIPTHMAFMEKGEMRVVTLKDGMELRPEMSECWMLFWFDGAKGWQDIEFNKTCAYYLPAKNYERKLSFDLPVLACLENKPRLIEVSENAISIHFPEQCGKVVLSTLYGARRLEGETKAWNSKIPKDAIDECRLQARLSRQFPVSVKEDVNVDFDHDLIEFTNKFEYIAIDDAWRTTPLRLAPLSPVVAMANDTGFAPLTINGALLDTRIRTPLGPYKGIANSDTCVWSLKGMLSFITTVEHYKPKPNPDPVSIAYREKLRQLPLNPGWDAETRAYYTEPELMSAWYRPYKFYEIARMTDYLDDNGKKKVDDSLKKAMKECFMRPENYLPSPPFLQSWSYSRLFKPLQMEKGRMWKEKFHPCGGDNWKFNANCLVSWWAYGYYTGDMETLDESWESVIKPVFHNFKIFLAWSRLGPENWAGDHFYGGGLVGTLSFTRMAYALGKEEDFVQGASAFSRMAIASYVWEKASAEYLQKNNCFNQPYDFSQPVKTYIFHDYLGFFLSPLDDNAKAGGIEEHWCVTPSIGYRFVREFVREPVVRYFENYIKINPGRYLWDPYTLLTGAYLMGEKPETLERGFESLTVAAKQNGKEKTLGTHKPFCWAGGKFIPLYEMAIVDAGSERYEKRIASTLPKKSKITSSEKMFGDSFFNYIFETRFANEQFSTACEAVWPELHLPGMNLCFGKIIAGDATSQAAFPERYLLDCASDVYACRAAKREKTENVVVEHPTRTSARVSWTTSELCSSYIIFEPTQSFSSQKDAGVHRDEIRESRTPNTEYSTKHSILVELKEGIEYQFQAVSTNINKEIYISPEAILSSYVNHAATARGYRHLPFSIVPYDKNKHWDVRQWLTDNNDKVKRWLAANRNKYAETKKLNDHLYDGVEWESEYFQFPSALPEEYSTWVVLDFGRDVEVDKVVIYWLKEHPAKAYTVSVGGDLGNVGDGSKWRAVVEEKDNKEIKVMHDVPKQKTRYLRLRFDEPLYVPKVSKVNGKALEGKWQEASLWEIEAYGYGQN